MNAEFPATSRPVDRLGRTEALDAVADPAQSIVTKLFGGEGVLPLPIRDALHGTWLGHSLHPIVTDVPIGAWTVAAVCDLFEILGVAQLSEAADVSLRIGTLSAFAAALTGWADWADTKDAPKRVGIVHAVANIVSVTGYITSIALRAAGRRRSACYVALGSYAVTGAAAYLGGELSTGMHLGAKHTVTPLAPPGEFVRVCSEDDVPDGSMKRMDVDGIAVLLSRSGSVISAVANACTHRGGPLDEGTREGDCVRCPWHGALFDLSNGAVREGPATFPLAQFEARIVEGQIEVRQWNS